MADLSLGAVVLGERPWWQSYFGVEMCARCGRDDGLTLGIQGEQFTVIGCDCNYQHIRDSVRRPQRPVLTVIGGEL